MPVSYDIWKRVGFFNLGAMERPEYALLVFRRHFDFAGMSKRPKGFTCLELGPGDSLSSALIGPAFGASQTYMVDVGSFANTDPATYHELAVYLPRMLYPLQIFLRFEPASNYWPFAQRNTSPMAWPRCGRFRQHRSTLCFHMRLYSKFGERSFCPL